MYINISYLFLHDKSPQILVKCSYLIVTHFAHEYTICDGMLSLLHATHIQAGGTIFEMADSHSWLRAGCWLGANLELEARGHGSSQGGLLMGCWGFLPA